MGINRYKYNHFPSIIIEERKQSTQLLSVLPKFVSSFFGTKYIHISHMTLARSLLEKLLMGTNPEGKEEEKKFKRKKQTK